MWVIPSMLDPQLQGHLTTIQTDNATTAAQREADLILAWSELYVQPCPLQKSQA